jgi:hypothetical protein
MAPRRARDQKVSTLVKRSHVDVYNDYVGAATGLAQQHASLPAALAYVRALRRIAEPFQQRLDSPPAG